MTPAPNHEVWKAVAFILSSLLSVIAGLDYGVVFGAFAGAMFYVTHSVSMPRRRQTIYFLIAFISGVLGADITGALLGKIAKGMLSGLLAGDPIPTESLDALGAIVMAAASIRILTFLHNQSLMSLLSLWLARKRGGGSDGDRHK